MGKIRYNGWFYKMAMVPFDMIIFKKTGRFLFKKPTEIFKTLSVRNFQAELYLMKFKL